MVTGTLTGGTLRRGQSVAIQPAGKVARIRNIQSHNRDVELGVPGTRTALNLPDIAASDDVRRGDVITLAEFGGPSEIIDVALEVSPRAKPHTQGRRASASFITAAPMSVRKWSFSPDKELAAGEKASLNLGSKRACLFLLGIALSSAIQPGRTRWPEVLCSIQTRAENCSGAKRGSTFLRRRAESPGDVTSFVASQIARDQAVRRSQLLLKSKFSAADISNAVSRLAAEGSLSSQGISPLTPLDGSRCVSVQQMQLMRTIVRTRNRRACPFGSASESRS